MRRKTEFFEKIRAVRTCFLFFRCLRHGRVEVASDDVFVLALTKYLVVYAGGCRAKVEFSAACKVCYGTYGVMCAGGEDES